MIDFGFDRFWKLSTAAGRLGWALLGNPSEQRRLKSAAKAIETLSRLKGAPMKLGQMLSLQEGMLPPEISTLLASLRKDAEPLPIAEIRGILENELGPETFATLEIDSVPIAAASLGQVHRARRDGVELAIKVQYPGIREALRSDLRILRAVMTAFSPMTAVPARKLLSEVKDRLLEEIDYLREAANLKRAGEMYGDPIVVPKPVDGLCTPRVLTTGFIPSLTLQEAAKADDDARRQWAETLLESMVTGAVRHKFLHADPNAANIGFLPEGRLVLYDFGCVKLIPESLSDGYANAAAAALGGRDAEIPQFLKEAGIAYKDGSAVSMDFLKPVLTILGEVFPDKETTFGSIPDIYAKLWQMGSADFFESRNIIFPPDIMFVHRTLLGHFGNLRTLRPRGLWRSFILRQLREAGIKSD